MQVLNALARVFSGLAILALLFTVFALLRYRLRQSGARRDLQLAGAGREQRKILLGGAAFVSSVVIVFVLVGSMKEHARAQLEQFLREQPASYFVQVNGSDRPDSLAVIETLRQLDPFFLKAHHSHPTHRVHLTIVGPHGRLELLLRRDSQRPQEYWVYVSRDGPLALNEVGRITTPIFDND
jgi:hypothetical protein